MSAAAAPHDRQHVLLFALTPPHQEVSITPQKLLDLQSWNGSVVPVLLPQRTVHVLRQAGDRKHLEAGKTPLELTGIMKHWQ